MSILLSGRYNVIVEHGFGALAGVTRGKKFFRVSLERPIKKELGCYCSRMILIFLC